MTPLVLLLILLLLKSLAVFALAGLTLLALRRASAASRHLVCLLTLAALLALPLFSQSRFSLPVAMPLGGPPAPTPINFGGSQKLGEGPLAQSSHAEPNDTAGSQETASPASAASAPAPQNWGGGASPASPIRPFSWPAALLALWLLGVLAASVRPLLGLWGIGQLNKRSRPETTPTVLSLAEGCAAALGLSRAPTVRRGDVPVPMTWGLRRPVVLLPDAASAWPEGRMQAVLLHELAHIRRRDWAAHRLADLTCALYWFHPLVWLTARRLRAEGEIACDDLVLSSGVPAPDYARHLLDIARALSPTSTAPAGTVAMARTAQVEGRITMILKPTQNRRALTRRALLLALLPATAAVGIVAALRPIAKGVPAPTLPSALPTAPVFFLAPKPQSSAPVTLQFAGVGDSQKLKWWSKTGAALPKPVFDLAWTPISSEVVEPDHHGLLFVFRLPPTAQDVTFSYTASNSGAGKTEAEHLYQGNGRLILKADFPSSASQTNIRVGIASGPWQTTATAAPSTDSHWLVATATQVDHTDYIISEPTKTTEGTVCTVSIGGKSETATQDFRLVALTTQGQETLPAGIVNSNANSVQQITAKFGLPPSQIKTVKLQTRPFRYVQFKNIALHPSQH